MLKHDPIFLVLNSLQRLSDIKILTQEFMDGLDRDTSQKYIQHVRKVEEVFRLADAIVEEEIEPNLVDSDSDDDRDMTEIICDKEDDYGSDENMSDEHAEDV